MQKIYYVVTVIFFLIFIAPVRSETLHFDSNLMAANGITSAQLDNALNQHVMPERETESDIYINGKYILSGRVFSVKNAAVYSEDIKSKAGIKALAWSPYKARNGSKYFYLDKQIQAKFDRANNTLRLLVPVKYLINPEGKQRLSGGNGAFINYNTYAYRFSGGETSLNSINTDYEAGINMKNTIIRSHGYYSSFSNRNARTAVNTIRDGYIERDYQNVRVRAGRTIVSDGGFGTGYIDGAIISSANGNATAFVNFNYEAAETLTVEFWQNNLLLWKQIIQKGHAELRNIPVAGFSDDVRVLVKRDGQIVDSRIISRAQITSDQDGNAGYYAFTGRTVNGSRSTVSGAGFSRTLNSIFAPSVAMVTGSGYRGLTVSNTAFEKDFRFRSSLTSVQNEKNQKGLSLDVSGSYKNTSLNFSRNSRHFSYIGQARLGNYNAQRSSIGLTQTQQFSYGVTGSISLTHYRFYDAPGFNSLSGSLNLPVGKASLGVGVSYMSLSPGQTQKDKISLNLFLSLPLSFNKHSANWRSQYYTYGNRARLSNSLSAPVSKNYTVTASQMRTSGAGRSESYSLDNAVITPYTTADVSLSQGRDAGGVSQTTAAYLSGAVAISKEGVIFSPNRIGNTWAVVDTGVHHYLDVASLQSSAVTNHDGKAIITPVAEGRNDFIRVSPEGLPSGVIIKNNVRDFSAVRGSVPFFKFGIADNRSMLLKWSHKPSDIHQSDLFYDGSGKLIARFIDKDILLIDEKDIGKLESEGMSSPTHLNMQCKLSSRRLNQQESIKNVIFNCHAS